MPGRKIKGGKRTDQGTRVLFRESGLEICLTLHSCVPSHAGTVGQEIPSLYVRNQTCTARGSRTTDDDAWLENLIHAFQEIGSSRDEIRHASPKCFASTCKGGR